MSHYDVNFEDEYKKFKTSIIEDYDYEITNAPEEQIVKSNFAKVLQLARLVMQEFTGSGNKVTNSQIAKKTL